MKQRPGSLSSFLEKNSDRLMLTSLVVVTLILYVSSLAPGLYFGDSGELAAAVHNLGIAHPPGYPLYLLLGKVFTVLVPIGEVATRMNLFSALFGALTVGNVYLIARQLSHSVWISAISALMVALGSTFWSQSIITEVYTLHMFFFSLILLLFLKCDLGSRERNLLMASIAGGFAMTHHISIAFYFPVLATVGLWQWPDVRKNGRLLACMALAFLLPLSLYIYLPLRSKTNPLNDWGNPETLGSLIDHIRAKQFGGMFMAQGWPGLQHQLARLSELIGEQWALPILLLALLGTVIGLVKARGKVLLFLALILINLIFSVTYFIGDIDAYFLTTYMLLSICTAYSLSAIQQWLKTRLPKLTMSVPLVTLLLLGMTLTTNFAKLDQSDNQLARVHAINILDSLEADSVLFVLDEDLIFPMAYLKIVENYRPDVTVYDLDQNIFLIPKAVEEGQIELADLQGFIDQLYNSGRTIYLSEQMLPGYQYNPYGLVYRLSKGENFTDDAWDKYQLDYLEQEFADDLSKQVQARSLLLKSRDEYTRGRKAEADRHIERALEEAGHLDQVIKRATTIYLERQNFDKVLSLTKTGIDLYPFDGDFYHLHGMIKQQQGLHREALEFYDQALNLSPDNGQVLVKRALLLEFQGDKSQQQIEKKKFYQGSLRDLEHCYHIQPSNHGLKVPIARLRDKLTNL